MFDLTLSFDNGPEPEVTPHVLDIAGEARHQDDLLRDRRKAARSRTPQPCGEGARRRPLDRQPHFYAFGAARPAARSRQRRSTRSRRTQALIGDLAHPQRWFRPFGGGGNLDDRLLKPSVVEHLTAGGYSCVLWNAIPRDWDDPEGWVDRALAQCRAQAWSLMVLHDLPSGAMRHLEQFSRPCHRGGRALPPGIPARLAFRSAPARSFFPSNPMYPPSKKALHHEDCEFQGWFRRELRHRHRFRHHRRRTPAEEFSDPEVAAGARRPR